MTTHAFKAARFCRSTVLVALVAGMSAGFALSVRAPAAMAKAAPMTVPKSTDAEVQPFEAYYGVYVGGQKVGWMRSSYVKVPVPTLAYHLEAQVRGMGRTSPVIVEEVRAFDAKTLLIQSVQFKQQADAGVVRVVAKRRGKLMECITTAGGADHKVTVPATETLKDAMAVFNLVASHKGQAAKVGDSVSTHHFDPQAEGMSEVQMRIDAITQTMVAGVSTPMFTITTNYPQMGVKEQSTVDGSGQLIQTQMGGFFEAKLEPIEVAKKMDLVQDVLIQAVVKAPAPLPHAETLKSLTLTMTGFDDAPPPDSARQRVERTGDVWRLTLTQDGPLTGVSYPAPKAAGSEPEDVALARKPTAFVQSQDKEIVQAAKNAVRGATTMTAAIEALVHDVQRRLRAEYVPAFSNALEALHTGRGDCTEFSVLFVALARAAGIPARVAVGVAYWPPGEGFGWHAWAEIYADGRWVSVDPTWGQPISDVTHLKFAEGGPQEQARVVMLLGRLKVLTMNGS